MRLRQYPLQINSIDVSVQTFVVLLALAEIGMLVVGGWFRKLRASPLVATGGLVMWPWVFPTTPFASDAAASYVFLLFSGVFILTGIELLSRHEENVKNVLETKTGVYATAFGTVHLLLGIGLEMYVRGISWASGIGVLLLVASAFGLFVLGAVPVILWSERRLISPGLLVVGWAAWGLYGTLQLRHSFPFDSFHGIEFSAIRPYPDYLFTWVILAILVFFLALGEREIRRGQVGI